MLSMPCSKFIPHILKYRHTKHAKYIEKPT